MRNIVGAKYTVKIKNILNQNTLYNDRFFDYMQYRKHACIWGMANWFPGLRGGTEGHEGAPAVESVGAVGEAHVGDAPLLQWRNGTNKKNSLFRRKKTSPREELGNRKIKNTFANEQHP